MLPKIRENEVKDQNGKIAGPSSKNSPDVEGTEINASLSNQMRKQLVRNQETAEHKK